MCTLKRDIGAVTGVTGCKNGDALDCAGLLPVGKLLKGGELAFDGVKWIHRAKEVDDGWDLNTVADNISRGHAEGKHAIEFPGWGRKELTGAIRDTIAYGDSRQLSPTRFAF